MSLEQLTVALTTAFADGAYARCGEILTPIKRELVKHALLVPTPTTNPSDVQIAQSILEIGALVSLNLGQLPQFEHYVTLLKSFYEQGTASANKNKLAGLHLLYLLAKGDLASFHVELEKYDDIEALEKDPYMSIPLKFEQWIIDGDFYRIHEYMSKGTSSFPSKEFQLFETDLLNSVRTQIAQNLEASYKTLELENLRLLLFIKDHSETSRVVESFGWEVRNGVVHFKPAEDTEEADERAVIKNTLGYAREMESIV